MIDVVSKSFNFPCGEKHVRVTELCRDVTFEFEKNEDIVELLLAVNALKHMGVKLGTLSIPYVPFSRQDRIETQGEPFSLEVFADLVNGLGFERVLVVDPHSDVTPALIKNCRVIPQDEVFFSQMLGFQGRWNDGDFTFEKFFLISPDGGALKKIYKLAARMSGKEGRVEGFRGVIECSKKRNVANGEIVGTTVHWGDLGNSDCLIVDDICDGGRTFIEIAKVLKTKNAGKIILMISHGFFTKGLDVFDGLIDEIYTRKGRIK